MHTTKGRHARPLVFLRAALAGVIGMGMAVCAQAQGDYYVPWTFTLNATNVNDIVHCYIIDTQTQEFDAAVFPIPGVFYSAPVDGGPTYSGSIDVGTNPPNGPQLLTLICLFVDTSNSTINVAVSMPSSLGGTLDHGAAWSDFNTSANFGFMLLPDEPTTLNDLTLGGQSLSPIQQAYNYLQDGNPVLNQPNTTGELVAFDGGENGGTFQFGLPGPAPEPSSLALGGFLLLLARRRKLRKRG